MVLPMGGKPDGNLECHLGRALQHAAVDEAHHRDLLPRPPAHVC